MFRAVRDLHTDRLAHRALMRRGAGTRRPGPGRGSPASSNGVVAATDVQERIDVAELLCTLGADRRRGARARRGPQGVRRRSP